MSWIGVKDRLPEPNKPVLTDDGEHLLSAVYLPQYYMEWDGDDRDRCLELLQHVYPDCVFSTTCN